MAHFNSNNDYKYISQFFKKHKKKNKNKCKCKKTFLEKKRKKTFVCFKNVKCKKTFAFTKRLKKTFLEKNAAKAANSGKRI